MTRGDHGNRTVVWMVVVVMLGTGVNALLAAAEGRHPTLNYLVAAGAGSVVLVSVLVLLRGRRRR